MRISMIAAVANNRVIGKDNDLAWHLPDDFKWFVLQTKHKPIIMGRRSFESIGSKPLPDRRNIIVSSALKSEPGNGIEVVSNVSEALSLVDNEPEVMIAGGEGIYSECLPLADRLYLTLVDAEVEGDTYFPKWDHLQWQETELTNHPIDDKHQYPYKIVILDRIR
ncbi:dihydrofolate reductase [Piscirickettsia litoralis]|uniref:Dihydrofolate reductase n=1 Tax=Piscirickettsia litoralis TaxID=1891921 RepID=A0ABX3A3D3_9GAMM|nr:dihydrofolate reductase [Piscirickettsia litoralis]ODN43149.1 diacylglycerol kinase [Piscirickettsia litoralis]